MKKILMPAIFASLMLVVLAASPVFASSRMAGAEPGGKDDPGPPIYYVVQFEGPIQQEWKDQVTERGGELLGYIPQFAFKVRMNPAQARKVEELDSVAGVVNFPSRAKLSRNLVLDDGPNLYRVKVERGADAGMVASAIAKTDARILRRDGELMLILVEGSEVEALANILDVARVENFQFHQKYNEGAGFIMRANLANANGYDGSTQTIAIADTGLGGGTATTAHADIPSSRITAIHNGFETNDQCIFNVFQDGAIDVASGHGTHVAVSALGDGGPGGEGKGTAPAAALVFQAVEDYVEFKNDPSCALPDGYYLAGIPYDLRDLYQQAYDDGARIHSDSWGSLGLGEYTIDSGNTDDFIWNNPDMSIVFAAGNDGFDLSPIDGVMDTCNPGESGITCWLSSPATAKNLITVGASENQRTDYACDSGLTGCDGENTILSYGEFMGLYHPDSYDDYMAGNPEQMAAFSSRGPAFDGRIKPDVVAPGTWILSGYSDMFQEEYDSDPNPKNQAYQLRGWGFPLNDQYKYFGGTSMATPLVAGGAALVRDYYQKDHSHSASAALVKATLINSADDMLDENNDGVNDNDFPIPNGHEGWGRVNLDNATDGSHEFVEETTGLSTDGVASYPFEVPEPPEGEATTPLKVSLVWSDHPSSGYLLWVPFPILPELELEISPGPNLVNDLDLEVTSPSGAVYIGNNFSGGWTLASETAAADRINNVENVYIPASAVTSGTWTVTVRGSNIPEGPQPYALVVDGVESADPLPPPPDTTGPTVTAMTPADGVIDVAVNTNVVVTFSEPVNGVNSTTFNLSAGGAAIASSVTMSADRLSATLDPDADLADDIPHTVTVTTGVTDDAGDPMAADFTSSFTTYAPPSDTTGPRVTSVGPPDDATDVVVTTNVDIDFSEPVDSTSLSSTTFTVKDATGNIAGTISLDATGLSATFNPDGDLANGTLYTVMLTGGVTDPSGNPLDQDVSTNGNQNFTSSFTTYSPSPSGPIQVAISDIPVSGTVSGSYLVTNSQNQVFQSITERASGGKPQNRHSYLVHKWGFNVPAGNVVTFKVNSYKNQSNDDDDFVFAYSTDGVNYIDMVTVTKTQATDSYQSYMLPNTTQGQVYVRVMDTNQMAGHKTLDTIYIDHMYISIETVPGDPPASPSDLAAADVTANQVDLTWLHDSEDESGFEIERSADGTTWTLIGSAGAGSTTYSDYGVSPSSTYHYRVRAINPSGSSAYADGLTVNTPDGLSLSATEYKVKGVQHGDLIWSGVTTGVDIYRDGAPIALNIAGSSYDDDIGVKGGGAYEYYICASSLPAECSNTVSVTF